jgi:hypothetical protein
MVIHEALYAYRTVVWAQERLDSELREAIEEGIRSGETEWLH